MDEQTVLEQWDRFVDQRALPYYRSDHKEMMRKVLNRFPLRKCSYLSDWDLLQTVSVKGDSKSGPNRRAFRYFLSHFDSFLEQKGIQPRGG